MSQHAQRPRHTDAATRRSYTWMVLLTMGISVWQGGVHLMCTGAQCQRHIGKYVRFQTPYGYHEGVIERVNGNQVTILSPRHYIPTQLASESLNLSSLNPLDLDLALVWGGFGRGGLGRGYAGSNQGGYGGYGGYGWGRWAVSFLIIYALWGLVW